MNNNMNENTKVTKDAEVTKATDATEVTTENVEERDVFGIMSIINEVSFRSIRRIDLEESKENAVCFNSNQKKMNDMFIKIRDIIYNDIIVKNDILCMTRSEYYTDMCNKHNMNEVYYNELVKRSNAFSIFEGLIHVPIHHERLNSFIYNGINLEHHESFVLKPIVIKEELDMFIYSYLDEIYSARFIVRCIVIGNEPNNIDDDCVEITVDSIKKDLELMLRYTNARIKVLRDFYDAMLNVGKEYNDEDERLGFYYNCLQILVDSDYGEIKSIYTDYYCYGLIKRCKCDEVVSYIKNKPLMKLILEKCNFTDLEFLKYLNLINFNSMVNHFISMQPSDDEFLDYLKSLCGIVTGDDIDIIRFRHFLQDLTGKIKDEESK